MVVIDPGHRYLLMNLKSEGSQQLQFYKDAEIHGMDEDVQGTSSQEVIRALIDRVKCLNEEKPHWVNPVIIQKARDMLALFEIRALQLKVEKGLLDIETLPIGEDGHIVFKD